MHIDATAADYDAIVIGGSYAGQSAALQLARARRRVLVIDAGQRRNRYASQAHGLLGHDGRPPGDIFAEAQAQLLAYPNVGWHVATARHARREGDGFLVEDEAGTPFRARTLVLALGVVDELPEIDGVAERWGRSVFHCPYCHGYELQSGRIGVIAVGDSSLHHALLLPDWGEVTLFLNEACTPDPEEQQALEARGIRVVTGRIARIADTATVVLEGEREEVFDGLFTGSRTQPATALAEELGCAIEEGPLGTHISTDESRHTTVPGVFACGDAAREAGNLALAVGDGAQAGIAAHHHLLFG